MENIYPHPEDKTLIDKKEALLHQHGVTIWFTGLSGSGKSTIATALERQLTQLGYLCATLDGDSIRHSLNRDLSFSQSDRAENIRRIAELSRLFNHSGVITLVSTLSPTVSIRESAREIIGDNRFILIYLSTPLEQCQKRDVKSLYRKAREGTVDNFTGISAPFETPLNADIEIDTSELDISSCCDIILAKIKTAIAYEL